MSKRKIEDLTTDEILEAVENADDPLRRRPDEPPVNGWVRSSGTCFKHLTLNPCRACLRVESDY
jgi:hypothetical protein